MKITVIIILNKNAHSQMKSSSKQFVLFRFNIISLVYTNWKQMQKQLVKAVRTKQRVVYSITYIT